MDWFFDGLGTLLIGMVLGGGGGSAVTWKVVTRRIKQTQEAGDFAQQSQVGRDVNKRS